MLPFLLCQATSSQTINCQAWIELDQQTKQFYINFRNMDESYLAVQSATSCYDVRVLDRNKKELHLKSEVISEFPLASKASWLPVTYRSIIAVPLDMGASRRDGWTRAVAYLEVTPSEQLTQATPDFEPDATLDSFEPLVFEVSHLNRRLKVKSHQTCVASLPMLYRSSRARVVGR